MSVSAANSDGQPWAAWTALALALVLAGPLFVCLPLTNDAEYYDLQAANVLRGGVLYRDMLEPNLPGVVWLHMLVRSIAGSRSEVLRIADLAIFGATLTLLFGWLRSAGVRLKASAWIVVALLWAYLSQTEWVHCQRDTWLLPWAIGAAWLRQRQIVRMLSLEAASSSVGGWALLEGVVWACGFWIKPYIAIPGLAAWLLTAALVRRPGRIVTDLAGLLAGGGVTGLAGIVWLVATGAWEPFWTTVREWNSQYFQAGREHWRWRRLIATAVRLAPWSLLVIPALIPAAKWLGTALRTERDSLRNSPEVLLRALLAAVWLAWLAQALLLQHQFDYVFMPVVGLSFVVVALQVAAWPSRPARLSLAYAFLILALFASPVLRPDRLAVWSRCWTEGSSIAVRQRLALIHNPHWEDLRRAEEFLRRQHAADRNVLCYHNSLVYLYRDLGLRPPTRYVYLESYMAFFRDRRESILQDVRAAHPEYVVTDLASTGMPASVARLPGPTRDDPYPPGFPEAARRQFPWNLPVVFRAGSILVHGGAPAANRLASSSLKEPCLPSHQPTTETSEGTVQ